MKEISIIDKQKYLEENYPFSNYPQLDDEIICLHCNTIYKVGKYKVLRDEDGDEFICCPSAPKCNGSVIDWISIS